MIKCDLSFSDFFFFFNLFHLFLLYGNDQQRMSWLKDGIGWFENHRKLTEFKNKVSCKVHLSMINLHSFDLSVV
jgi:hypothetical protein